MVRVKKIRLSVFFFILTPHTLKNQSGGGEFFGPAIPGHIYELNHAVRTRV